MDTKKRAGIWFVSMSPLFHAIVKNDGKETEIELKNVQFPFWKSSKIKRN